MAPYLLADLNFIDIQLFTIWRFYPWLFIAASICDQLYFVTFIFVVFASLSLPLFVTYFPVIANRSVSLSFLIRHVLILDSLVDIISQLSG